MNKIISNREEILARKKIIKDRRRADRRSDRKDFRDYYYRHATNTLTLSLAVVTLPIWYPVLFVKVRFFR